MVIACPFRAPWLAALAGAAMLVQTANAQQPVQVDAAAPPLAQIEAPVPGSLYVRMGGAHTVEAVIGELIDHVSVDPRTRRPFDKVNLKRLKRQLSAKVCSLTGGGCNYTGDSMHDAHAGLGIDEAEFYALVEVLRDSLRNHGVALRERNELLQILAPIKRDVVER